MTQLIPPPSSGGGGGVTDHGALTGLADNDHNQYPLKTQNLADLASVATARTNLGLGTAAVENVGTFETPAGAQTKVDNAINALVNASPATLDTLAEIANALNDDPDLAGTLTALIDLRLLKSNNLSDLANAGTARTNLGLGTAATHAHEDYDAAGVAAGLVDDLSGVSNQSGARTNLGLGTMAVEAAADYVPKALVDSKGDLIVATAADTPARLAAGTNGQVLTADSAESSGLKWADAEGGGGGVETMAALQRTGSLYGLGSWQPDGLAGLSAVGSVFTSTIDAGTKTNIAYADRALGMGTTFDTTSTINTVAYIRTGQTVHPQHLMIFSMGFSLAQLTDLRFFAGISQNGANSMLENDTPNDDTGHYIGIMISPTLNSGKITLVHAKDVLSNTSQFASVDTGVTPVASTKYILVIDFSASNTAVVSIYNAAGTQLYTTTISDTTKLPLYDTNIALMRVTMGLINTVASSKKWTFHGAIVVPST